MPHGKKYCLASLLIGSAWVGAAEPASGHEPPPAAPAAPGVATRQPPGVSASEKAPAQVVLGRRIQTLRDKATYLSTVVIVTDAWSYVEAIAGWTPARRYPVLIDDGSAKSRDDIARFVRGYVPERVVRWAAARDGAKGAPAQGAQGFDAGQVAHIQSAVQRVWGVAEPGSDDTKLAEAWKKAGHTPPGIVITPANDRAWTAALALSAAWGQPLAILAKPPDGNIDWSMSITDADGLESQVEAAANASGWSWDGLGDDIDSVTLCMNGPERIKKDNEFLALTDRLGRKGDGVAMKNRWAWSGHIFGSASECAYRAMCSLFLTPRRAWVFDGYADTKPWNQFDGTKAAQLLTEAGVKADLDDSPKQSAADWRLRCAAPVTADLIFVNTKGNNDFFDLEPGQCKPGDIPMLTRPAALHLVHSWSLLFPGKRESVGGRWLERGVFVYAGSVHEPFLQAFTPTPTVAGRLMSGAPFAPAIRVEGQPPWKIAVLGDPLYTPGPSAARSSDLPTLKDCVVIGEDLKQLLGKEDWESGVLAMKLLGRDADIARLISALMETKPAALTPRLLREVALAAFQTGDIALLVKAFEKLPPDAATDGMVRDCLWLAAAPLLRTPDPKKADQGAVLRALKGAVREDQLEVDAKALGDAWTRQFGPGATTGLFAELRTQFGAKEQQAALDKAQAR